MRNRRGVALLAALWLVVAIAAVALALGLEAQERRTIGLAAADRTAARAAALGGLAVARARLEAALRRPPSVGSTAELLRASDPWLDADSLFTDPLRLGGATVRIRIRDLGAKLNINTVEEEELRHLLAIVLRDDATADALAQAIADWRDPDDLRRLRGAERADYLARGRLDLPPNQPLRSLDELRLVEGMTPERFERLRPYLTTAGSGRINVNAAPEPVLRALPGLPDAVVTRILGLRSQGQRVRSVAELVLAVMRARGGAGQPAWPRRLFDRVTLVTTELEVTVTAAAPPPARPAQLRAIVSRRSATHPESEVTWLPW